MNYTVSQCGRLWVYPYLEFIRFLGRGDSGLSSNLGSAEP